MIIINYYYIIYNYLNYFARLYMFARTNVPSNGILCKANLYSDFMVPRSGRRSCRRDLQDTRYKIQEALFNVGLHVNLITLAHLSYFPTNKCKAYARLFCELSSLEECK